MRAKGGVPRVSLGRLVRDAYFFTNAGWNPEARPVMRRIEGRYEPDDHFANAYGYILMVAGHLEEAIPWFQRCLTLNDKHARATVDLAHCLLVTGNRAEGRRWAKEAKHHGEPWAWEGWKAGRYDGPARVPTRATR